MNQNKYQPVCKICEQRGGGLYKGQNIIVEFSYINKDDGKDIICLPSQTMCNLACKFCHTTDYIGKIKNVNLEKEEILYGVNYIIDNLNLKQNTKSVHNSTKWQIAPGKLFSPFSVLKEL